MKNLAEIKKFWPVLLIGLLAAGGFYFFLPVKEEAPAWENVQATESQPASSSSETSEAETTMMVDIKGEVKKPGVYELAAGARVKEVVLLAGGFTENAEERQLNPAEKLADQQMIYVPNKEEAAEMPVMTDTPTSAAEGATGAVININTADLTELQQSPGIGAAKAQAIIDYREENGGFKSVDELTEVSGIGEKTLEKLRDSVAI